MKHINKEKFLELAEIQAPHCVSLYMPTHREGHAENRYMDETAYKNLMKEAQTEFENYGLNEEEIEKFTKSLRTLEGNEAFWKQMDHGLAAFYYNGTFEVFKLPYTVKQEVFVSNHLLLKPLAEHLSDNSRFYLLQLSLGEVKLYVADSDNLSEISLDESIPTSLTDALGEELEEASLQVRSDQSHNENGIYHGHGRGSQTEKKEEAFQFFKKLDQALSDILSSETSPLMVACVDYLFPIYQEANSYAYLSDQFVAGNYEHEDKAVLFEKAKAMAEQNQPGSLTSVIAEIEANLNKGEASYEVSKVIPAAIGGRVQDLVIDRNEQLWGVYVQETHSIETDNEQTSGNTDLINKAVVSTIKNGGNVHFTTQQEMEFSGSPVAAVLRY